MKNYLIIIFLVSFVFTSCGKESSDGGGGSSPSNLIVNATVNTDNSGNVSFTASATNVSTYDFDYGDGAFTTVASGIVTYKYYSSGSYTVSVTAKSSSGQTVSKSIQINVTVVLALAWSDEFDIPGAPDPTKWGYDLGDGCPGNCGWGNNELEYYTNRPDNAIVSGGTLKIIAKAESYSGKAYTSARLLSKDKFSFKYGKVEVKAKLPAGIGTWPAIWMLGNNIGTAGWPGCGEIDIMEHLGKDLNKIYGTFHYPGRSGGNANGNTRVISNATTTFHIYTLEWTPTLIKIFVDGDLVHNLTNTASLPFNQNFFLILNVAMGGDFPGPVDPSFISAAMEIDYVRVYQ